MPRHAPRPVRLRSRFVISRGGNHFQPKTDVHESPANPHDGTAEDAAQHISSDPRTSTNSRRTTFATPPTHRPGVSQTTGGWTSLMSLGEQLLGSRSLPQVAQSLDRVMTTFAKAVYTRQRQMVVDAAITAAAFWLAYLSRFDGVVPPAEREQFALTVTVIVGVYLASNLIWSRYASVWRIFNLADAAELLVPVGFATFVTLSWRVFAPFSLTRGAIPTGVLLIHPVLTYSGWCAARLARRLLHQRVYGVQADQTSAVELGSERKRVILVGAGEAGLYLLREIRNSSDYEIVGFLDDEPTLYGRSIGGLRVLGPIAELETIVDRLRISEVILCLPSAPQAVIQKIAQRCARIPVATSSVPALWEIMSGSVMIGHLR